MSERYSAGVATAYGAALRGGYTGTYNDFCNDIAKLGDITEELGDISATATTLEAGSSATASYNEGVFTFGIPRGANGAQGERGETGAKGDKGDTGETGATGATGNGIASIVKTGTSGLVDTYTITFTDGATSTFTVTNGTAAIDDTLSIAGRAADAKATGDAVDNLKSDLNGLDSDLYDISTSINRYNSALVTSETITTGKQLRWNGTLIDNNNMDVSPFLEIEPNTQYTMGFVPKYGGALTPWYAASTAIVFFDESQNNVGYVDGVTSSVATFTTPANAKYYRFNIYRSAGLNVNIVNARTMLVYGDALPESFSSYTGDSKTLKSDCPIKYTLSNGILTVTSPYGSGAIVVEFGKRGPNNLPDFRFITADGRQKYNNSTDWFGPFVLEAINNIDGDNPKGAYTGGNHNYNDTGSMDSTATARNINLFYYADGKSLSDGDSGFCSIVEIAWTNRVQAYNTKKADGTGREVLEERHTLKFNGAEWEAYTEIEALEDIFCSQYYGMQCAVTQYPTIYMIGATYRKRFVYTEPHDSGNNDPNIYVAYDANDRLEMEVDRSVDLGKGTMYGASGTQGFRTSGSKGYTYFITSKNLAEGDVYGARGWYRFMPQY